MSAQKVKPTRWWYVIALFLPVFACGIASVLIYRAVPKLPGAFDTLNMNSLIRVTVPGSAEINFKEAGAYALYYEYRSTIDGVGYERSQYPPRLNCQLISRETGRQITLASPLAEGDMYSSGTQGRAGVLMKTISIDQPGIHEFSCRYPDERSEPRIVLAIGPNFVWEFFNIAVKPVGAVAGGMLVFFIASMISLIIVIVVAIMRYQSKNKILNSNSG